MELVKKRKFRMTVCFFIAYLCLIAFCLAATNRAPVRNNESMILSDYTTGQELETVPYGNHTFSMVLDNNKVMHAPVNLMSGDSFHIEFKAELEGVSSADVVVNLSAAGYDMSSCSFNMNISEGANVVEGDLVFKDINHPAVAELSIFTTTDGANITVTKPNFKRDESVQVGYLAYTALGLTVVFAAIGLVLLFLDRTQAAKELRGEM